MCNKTLQLIKTNLRDTHLPQCTVDLPVTGSVSELAEFLLAQLISDVHQYQHGGVGYTLTANSDVQPQSVHLGELKGIVELSGEDAANLLTAAVVKLRERVQVVDGMGFHFYALLERRNLSKRPWG